MRALCIAGSNVTQHRAVLVAWLHAKMRRGNPGGVPDDIMAHRVFFRGWHGRRPRNPESARAEENIW